LAARPLFVVGPARSGTTLVRALLSAHPSIELRNEPELILSLVRAGVGADDVVAREDRLGLLFDLGRTGLTRQHLAALPPSTIEAFLTDREEMGFKAIYERLLPRPDDELVWGDKSLGNAHLMDEIAALYTDALFVHVLRHPRATTWSYAALHLLEAEHEELELDRETLAFVATAAMRWAAATDAIDGSSKELPDRAVVTVRFEELVESPAPVLERVCSLVGVEFDQGMLDPERRRRDPVLASREFAHRRLSEPVDPARAAAGDQLPAWAASVVERYAGPAMKRHGYAGDGDELGSDESEIVARELTLLEPILRERLAREQSRRGAPERRAVEGADVISHRSKLPKLSGLAKLAATAERRRGDDTDSSEVEALRSLAAEAVEQLEEARSSEVRARRSLDAANARVKTLREQKKRRKGEAKRRRKAIGPERKRGRTAKG
jgi:hypothetical protein